MLDRLPSALRIGLSTAGIALVRTSGWPRPRIEILADTAYDDGLSSAELLTSSLQQLFDETKIARQRATVILADDWVRYLTVAPPHNAARLHDCMAAAQLRLQALYDASAADWHIEAQWDARQPFLACAVPRWLPDVLAQMARERKLVLLGILPQCLAAWEQWRRHVHADTWFGLVHAQRLRFAPLHGTRLSAVHTAPVPAGADADWLADHLARAALLHGVPAPTQVQLCGEVPPVWIDTRDAAWSVSRLDAGTGICDDTPRSSGVALAMRGMCA